jgi:methionyl aminopeptidase
MGIPSRPRMVTIKRPDEIAKMRHAGQILVEILEVLHAELRPGITTGDLDRIADEMIRDADAEPSFLGYHGTYPASICTSINDEVVHGIPSRRRRIEEADVIGIDIGCIWQGWHADCARTWSVGPSAPSRKVAELIDATRRGMEAGIAAAIPGNRLGDVGAAIEAVAHEHGFGIVRPFVGHGIGTEMHEEPSVPNYGTPGRGMLIQAGMCFAIEPMFTLGSGTVEVLDDDWTVVTVDGSLAAHFENTMAVTDHGPDVLTIR